MANPSIGTDPGTTSTATIGSPEAAAHWASPSACGWWVMSRYASVTIAPRRFQRRRPTMWTPATLNAFAVRTMEPMFRSCSTFSTATWSGDRRVDRSATIAATVQYRYLSITFRESPRASSSGSNRGSAGHGSGWGPTGTGAAYAPPGDFRPGACHP